MEDNANIQSPPQIDKSARSRNSPSSCKLFNTSSERRPSEFSDKLEDKGSQWERLMRRFSEDCKADDSARACGLSLARMKCEMRPLRKFWTGSTYLGTWNDFGMSGYGIYTYPDGATYEGEFQDNMFHGEGTLRYPNGTSIKGTWANGVLVESSSSVICPDGVTYREQGWQYCTGRDRRFSVEYARGLKPAGKTFFAAEACRLDIPKGWYDCGDGFFDPKTNRVYDYKDLSKSVRVPSMSAREWIMKNCRTSEPVESLGPQPKLYEEWVKPVYDYEHPPPPPEHFTEKEFLRTFMSPSFQEDLLSDALRPSSSLESKNHRRFHSFESGAVSFSSPKIAFSI